MKNNQLLKSLTLALMGGLCFATAIPGFAATSKTMESDVVGLPGLDLPPIGKWMLTPNGGIAHWLGDLDHGDVMDEPINIIIRIDTDNAYTAKQTLLKATAAAGFRDEFGHSSGYQARIGDELAQQFPSTATHAFSDGSFLTANDHGRIFGPVIWNQKAYFTAAFSREDVSISPTLQLRHPYSSFARARDYFAGRMIEYGGASSPGRVPLKNKVPFDDSMQSTGDHDGNAILLDL